MLSYLFAWYNLPFWGMMIFVVMLLGATTFLGQFGEADVDSDLEIDADADLAIDTDISGDVELDVDTDIDLDVNIESDIETDLDTHIGHAAVTSVESSATIVDTDEIKSQKGRPGLIFVLFSQALKFINTGKIPLSMLLSSLLTIWGVTGLVINYLIFRIFTLYPAEGITFSGVLILSFITAIPFVRFSSKFLGNIFESKSYHTSKEDYIGMSAKVTSHIIPVYDDVIDGKSIGILELVDHHGIKQKLYAFIPDNCNEKPKYKDNVIIIDYIPERRLYKVLLEDSNEHLKWNKTSYK